MPHWKPSEGALETWPVTFRTPGAALTWADAYLTDPHVQSQMAQVKRDKVQQSRNNGASLHGLQETAETISVAVASLTKPAGPLFRYVYGRNTHYLQIADYLAHAVWSGPGDGPVTARKTISQCRDLALLLMESSRRWERFRRRIAMGDVAQLMGIQRQRLYDVWVIEVSWIRREIQQLIGQAERDLQHHPAMRGIIE